MDMGNLLLRGKALKSGKYGQNLVVNKIAVVGVNNLYKLELNSSKAST